MNERLRSFIEEGVTIVQSGKLNKADAARLVIEKHKLNVANDTLRIAISKELLRQQHKSLSNVCDERGIEITQISHYWDKSKEISAFVKMPDAGEQATLIEAVKEILSEYNPDFQPFQLHAVPSGDNNNKALKVTIADAHVGMDPNKNNNSIFKYEYNAEIFNQNIDHVIKSIIKEYNTHGRFEVLIIQDMGDGLDGVDAMTLRKGHTLPQNLDNVGQFKTYVYGKLRLAETAIKMNIADRVEFKSTANCNHAGWFGEIANITIQSILERAYDPALFDFYIQTDFIEHFYYGDHCFIMTHGKDKDHMKHGLPKHLDFKTQAFVNSYIDHYEINAKYIHFEKADLHTTSLDRSKKFDYRNFMSFAPPSGWVQNNFGDTYSGYAIQTIPKHTGDVSHADYIFEFKKAKRVG